MKRTILFFMALVVMQPLAVRGAQEEPIKLEEVVVTATRTETPVRQVSAATTVITRQEIEAAQVTDVLELLRDVPGFRVVQTGSRGGTTSLFTRGGQSNYNLVLVDGVKVNSAGGFFDFSYLTTDNIERIEIIRGPQSALYGSDAISSVIQIFARRGKGPLTGQASFLGGNFRTFEEKLQFSGGTERIGTSFSVGRIDTEGILPINNDYRNTALSSRLDFAPMQGLDLALTSRYNTGRFEFPTESAGDRLQGALDPRQFADRWRLILGASGRHQLRPWWEQKFQFGFTRENRVNRHDPDPPVDTRFSLSKNQEDRFGADYLWNFTLPVVAQLNTTVTLGWAWDLERLKQRSVTSSSKRHVDKTRRNPATYLQGQFGWMDQLFLTAGARLDENSIFGTSVNPKVSVAWVAPWTKTKLRGGYGSGIKEPSFSENFGGATFVGNPDLKPERSRSWEVGIDQPILDGRMELGVTYFFNTFDDMIAFVSSTEGFKNIQKAETQGVEFGLRAQPLKGLTARASYTFLQTEVLDDGGVGGTAFTPGKPLLRRPRHKGAVSLTYQWDRLTTDLNVTMVRASIDRDFSKSGSPRVNLSGYPKVDLALSYAVFKERMGFKELNWVGKAQNLFNQKYEEVFGFSTAPFNFLTGFEARF